MIQLGALGLLTCCVLACDGPQGVSPASAARGASTGAATSTAADEILETATFAGGCFWCMEPPFEKLAGVIEVVSGYSGGTTEDPSYEEVSAGRTGHAEAVQVRYDPARITYAELLEVFWRQIDPTDAGGQFGDRGRQYRTAIFYRGEEQRVLAERSKTSLERSGRYDRSIVTEIVPFTRFYPAEAYHQDYYKKNPLRYKLYRSRSGRDRYLQRIWESEF